MLEDEREGAGGRVILGQLMMVEIIELGGVLVPDVEHGGGGIGKVGGSGLAADDGRGVEREEDRAREEFVFVGTAGVREDRGDGCGHEESEELGRGRCAAMADVEGAMGTEKFEERVAHRSRGRGLWGGRSDFSWRHKLDHGLHGGNGYARARRSRFRLTCAVRIRGASARGEIPSFSDPSFLTIQGRSGGRGVSEECGRKCGWKNVRARQRGVGGGRWVRSEDFRS